MARYARALERETKVGHKLRQRRSESSPWCGTSVAETAATSLIVHHVLERNMKAVVFHGIGDIRLDEVTEPQIQEPTDAIVRLTSSAICGTDLHFIRGTVTGMVPG